METSFGLGSRGGAGAGGTDPLKSESKNTNFAPPAAFRVASSVISPRREPEGSRKHLLSLQKRGVAAGFSVGRTSEEEADPKSLLEFPCRKVRLSKAGAEKKNHLPLFLAKRPGRQEKLPECHGDSH